MMTTKTSEAAIASPPRRRLTVRSRFNQKSTINKNSNLHLGEKLFGDALVGCGVTFGIAPFISIVDKAIVQRAARTHTIYESTKESIRTIVRAPNAYVKSPMFLMMWGVYAVTYTTANSLKTITEHYKHIDHYASSNTAASSSKSSFSATKTPSSSSSFDKMNIFLGTTIVNSGASLWKDKAYAKMFSTTPGAVTSAVTKSIPSITYGLWIARDFMVVGSSFILPDLVTKFLLQQQGSSSSSSNNNKARICGIEMNHTNTQRVSQVLCPIVTQFFVSPIQMLALDYYNRPAGGGTSIIDRMKFVYNGFTSILIARVARIVPGFAVGGVLNTKCRTLWNDFLRERNEHKDIHHNMTSTITL